MKQLKLSVYFISVLLLIVISSFSQQRSGSQVRILFIPLDDRPPCDQFTRQMALIGEVDMVSVPKELLGRFTTAGQSDKIITWLKSKDLNTFDAAIISVDMLAYGGLVGSRVFNVTAEQALQRVEFLKELRKKFPRIKIYAQSVIMRLAPTADGKNELYREDLSKWAEVSVQPGQHAQEETRKLEAKIPAAGLMNYKAARERNLMVNLKAIEYIKSGVFDYLVLSQDDAKPVGIHVADRERLQAETRRLGLGSKVAVQPGADEVSMLLLSRALNTFYKITYQRLKQCIRRRSCRITVMPLKINP
jgi:hypothetical protein